MVKDLVSLFHLSDLELGETADDVKGIIMDVITVGSELYADVDVPTYLFDMPLDRLPRNVAQMLQLDEVKSVVRALLAVRRKDYNQAMTVFLALCTEATGIGMYFHLVSSYCPTFVSLLSYSHCFPFSPSFFLPSLPHTDDNLIRSCIELIQVTPSSGSLLKGCIRFVYQLVKPSHSDVTKTAKEMMSSYGVGKEVAMADAYEIQYGHLSEVGFFLSLCFPFSLPHCLYIARCCSFFTSH